MCLGALGKDTLFLLLALKGEMEPCGTCIEGLPIGSGHQDRCAL